MAKPYDATTKWLLEQHPEDWVRFLGLPDGPVTLLDADLSTITSAADRLIRVDAPSGPYILHNEFEAGKHGAEIPSRLLLYNAATYHKYRLPVVTTVFLLHPGADSPQLTGTLEVLGPNGQICVMLSFRIVRVWLREAEEFLTAAGLSLLPFAPIAAVEPDKLPTLIARMQVRIDREARSTSEAADLWTAAYVLLGIKYGDAFTARLLKGVRSMQESSTYQAILREGEERGRREGEERGRREGEERGRSDEARRGLLRVGDKRFGPAPADVRARIEAIGSVETLEALLLRSIDVETWDELLRETA